MGIRIFIVDDHGLLRAGLSLLLESEKTFDVVGEAGSAEQALSLIPSILPDVVLMDISLPGMDGIQATVQVKARFPKMHVLILTVHEDKSLLLAALQAGASGYILKQAAKDELIVAIQAILQDHLYIHPAMTRALLAETSPETIPPPAVDQLTPREVEVLKLVVEGYTNTQTAKLLHISVRTIEYHRENIMSKLNLTSRVELMRYAKSHNLV